MSEQVKETEVTGIFNKIYGASKEMLEALKKPQIERALKRKFESAYDDAEKMIVEKTFKITEVSSKDFERYDVNFVLDLRFEIDQLKDQQEKIKAEYLFMFGTEMKV